MQYEIVKLLENIIIELFACMRSELVEGKKVVSMVKKRTIDYMR